MTCTWEASRQPRVKSSLATGLVCGSRERSGGRQRGKDGTEVVAVPWRQNEDDAKMDGERPNGVGMMDKGCKKKLEMEEHVPVQKRLHMTREDLEVFGFTARCPGCMSLLKGTARQAHTEKCQRRIEEELRDTLKAEAAQSA